MIRGIPGTLPLETGKTYDIQVDFVGGFPSLSGMLVKDGAGLVLAAATDQRLWSHVLKSGLSELDLAVEEGECSSRPPNRCYEGIFNMKLRATKGEQTAELWNGRRPASAATGSPASRPSGWNIPASAPMPGSPRSPSW